MIDYIIIGAGPASLSLAHLLSSLKKSILIIEKSSVIGGCHRVERVGDKHLFTEHSPRIYSNSYINFSMLLKDMGTSFNEIFTPYKFDIGTISGKTVLSVLSARELALFAFQFLLCIFKPSKGSNQSVGDFMSSNNFSLASRDMVDRLCRLSDGVDSSRYTLNKFIDIFNEQFLYQLYQPRLPMDKGMLLQWRSFLEKRGVEFQLDTSVLSVSAENGAVSGVVCVHNGVLEYKDALNIVLAIPPSSMVPILEASSDDVQNSFMPIANMREYSVNNSYNTYISMCFHWDVKLELSDIYGFTNSDWGLIFVILSDYMVFDEAESKTVISCTLSILDKRSDKLGKTANEASKDELISETFRQLSVSIINLPSPTYSLLSPEIRRDINGARWISSLYPFVETPKSYKINSKGKVRGLYNVGTHNYKSKYSFTSLESAVNNSICLAYKLEPSLPVRYKPKLMITVRFIIIIFVCVVILLILLFRTRNRSVHK